MQTIPLSTYRHALTLSSDTVHTTSIRQYSLPVLVFLFSFCPSLFAADTHHSKQPNIILILADDLGYSDLGCYGSEIETPRLNDLAENGIRFTQMYNAARCCPSRASLLTALTEQKSTLWMDLFDD